MSPILLAVLSLAACIAIGLLFCWGWYLFCGGEKQWNDDDLPLASDRKPAGIFAARPICKLPIIVEPANARDCISSARD